MEATMNEWEPACDTCVYCHPESDNCPTECEDCEAMTTVTLEPYGDGWSAKIECPNCGVSYDTNLDTTEVGK